MMYKLSFFSIVFIFPQMTDAGYTEVVQLLINSANDAERVKRMLETVDAEGDTVSISQITSL